MNDARDMAQSDVGAFVGFLFLGTVITFVIFFALNYFGAAVR